MSEYIASAGKPVDEKGADQAFHSIADSDAD